MSESGYFNNRNFWEYSYFAGGGNFAVLKRKFPGGPELDQVGSISVDGLSNNSQQQFVDIINRHSHRDLDGSRRCPDGSRRLLVGPPLRATVAHITPAKLYCSVRKLHTHLHYLPLSRHVHRAADCERRYLPRNPTSSSFRPRTTLFVDRPPRIRP